MATGCQSNAGFVQGGVGGWGLGVGGGSELQDVSQRTVRLASQAHTKVSI